ncbi:MAG: methyltransferase domain-containing protein [Polyangiales bacterium]
MELLDDPVLADARLLAAFREVILALVPEGSHVVELGGGTGVLSFFASQRARKVRCVERLPDTVATTRQLLRANGATAVEVVEADALNYLPDEPVDVLICELLYPALLREKQAQVLSAFKARHRVRFGRDVPLVIPEATQLAVQPVHQPYDFAGYHAPVPLFFAPGAAANTQELGPAALYATLDYAHEYSLRLHGDQRLRSERDGTLNALRFVTRNVLGALPRRSVDWAMHTLVLPLAEPLEVRRGQELRVTFEYDVGGSVEALTRSLRVSAAWGGM